MRAIIALLKKHSTIKLNHTKNSELSTPHCGGRNDPRKQNNNETWADAIAKEMKKV